jgi:hypothetical protein
MKKTIALVLLLCPMLLYAQSGTGTVSGDSIKNLNPIFLPDNPAPKVSADVISPEPPKPVFNVNLPEKPWFKDWKPLTVLGYAVGSGVANIVETNGCRARVGISPCNGGYGALTARNALNLGTSVGFGFLSILGRHWGFKEWAAPSVMFSTYQTYEAVHQSTIGCPAGQHYLYGTKYNCVPNYSSSW